MYIRGVNKDIKVGFNIMVYDSVYWCVDRCVGDGFCRGGDGELNM